MPMRRLAFGEARPCGVAAAVSRERTLCL